MGDMGRMGFIEEYGHVNRLLLQTTTIGFVLM